MSIIFIVFATILDLSRFPATKNIVPWRSKAQFDRGMRIYVGKWHLFLFLSSSTILLAWITPDLDSLSEISAKRLTMQ